MPKRDKVRGVGIELGGLLESSRFGQNARRELIRWFPSSPWIQTVDRNPFLREQILDGRRDVLKALIAGAALPVTGCSALTTALPLIFEAIGAAQKLYAQFEASGGTALFTNNSQSRERSQLLTGLLQGKNESNATTQDEAEFLVSVPGGETDYTYPFEGLVSGLTGDHFFSGTAAGETLLSEVFEYVG